MSNSLFQQRNLEIKVLEGYEKRADVDKLEDFWS